LKSRGTSTKYVALTPFARIEGYLRKLFMSEQKASIPVEYVINPAISNKALNALFDESWPNHNWRDFTLEHQYSLAYIVAYAAEAVGYVNLAWDGGIHAFLLNPTVHPHWRRREIGRNLVEQAAQVAKARGIHWLHVDYQPELQTFYEKCGFKPTQAALLSLQ
jgi:GNAT superfamily N-acetyltransferase